ncbi:alpha/beta-hydrolase [Gymnopus androsaceus JB14]|uniref:Alpha/beta-hydrolase n=1 Tax=Gymnopus androsaceus JB14 TaxID=1447944 RepID=A0A6A4GWE2_9AGAR|nr:alpha/beta-hydrolase [Gymnopus androsaceus JB14]
MAPHIYTPDTYTTPPKLDESKYAAVSWPLYLWMSVKVMFLAPVLATEALLSPFVARSKQKSLKRVIGDTAFRYLTDNLSGAELQYFMGTSVGTYSSWARKANLPIVIDELEDGGKLLWIGPKRTEKVLLYCHGGAYIVPVQEFTIPFWRYIQLELEKQGIEVGIAIMSYSLIPVGQFPAPLWQASRAIQHLLTTENVKPSSLQLVGDSAGGNLVAQVLSSMLHPLFSPPIILPGIRLRGAYMMSPCISEMTALDPKLERVSRSIVLASAQTSSEVMYIEPIHAPSEWYCGLSDFVDRVFISTGGAECLQDHSCHMFFEDMIKLWHGQAEYFEIEGECHTLIFRWRMDHWGIDKH